MVLQSRGQLCAVRSHQLTVVLTFADSLGTEAPNLALSACQVELRAHGCGDGSCGQASFFVTAVTDFTRDGNRPSVISVLPAPGAPRLWRNYVPKSLKVGQQLPPGFAPTKRKSRLHPLEVDEMNEPDFRVLI